MIKQKGSVLILILWVLVILSILSISVSYRASGDIKLAKYESDSIKAVYLARAGFIKMLAGLSKDTNSYDSLNEDWNKGQELELLGGVVTYSALDESKRLNLNGQGLVKENLIALGIGDVVSQEILDYRLSKAGKGFEFMEELFLVDGMTKGVYDSIGPYVTIYRGVNSEININTAGERVLDTVLFGNTNVADAIDIIKERNGLDGKEGTSDDKPFTSKEDIGARIPGLAGSPLFIVKSEIFRIHTESYFSKDKEAAKRVVVSVVSRDGKKIYYWKEE